LQIISLKNRYWFCNTEYIVTLQNTPKTKHPEIKISPQKPKNVVVMTKCPNYTLFQNFNIYYKSGYYK